MECSMSSTEQNCDVCGQTEFLETTGSALGPASISRCNMCLTKGAEPFGLAAVFFGRNGEYDAEAVKNQLTWKDGEYLSILDASKQYSKEFSKLFEVFLENIRNP